MMINSIGNTLSIATNGLKNAAKEVEKSAVNIVNADTQDVNVDSEMVNMLAASQSYKANATVIATTKRMGEELGKIFDERV